MSELRFPRQRVCIVLLSGIGDVVNGLPVVNALKRDDPMRAITWIVQSEAAPILRPHPAIDEVITFNRRRGWYEVRRLWRELRRREFDLVLNLNIYFKSAIPTMLAQAPHRIGFGRDRARDLVWLAVNHRLPPGPHRHRVDMYLEFVRFLGLPPGPVEWRLAPTEEERRSRDVYVGGLGGRPIAGLVATAGRGGKDWPVERFAELAAALDRDRGFTVLLLGGPGKRERERAAEIARRAGPAARVELGPDLRRLIWLIDGCDLIVAPDTGPLHIARALGVPVIGLYGHTDPLICGPYRAYGDLLIDRFNYDASAEARTPTPDSAPTKYEPARGGRPRSRLDRMPLITVADVLEKVEIAARRYLTENASRQAKDSAP